MTDPLSGQHKSVILQEPPPDDVKSLGQRRDTRRWCRGKVGVEHDAVWQILFWCDWKVEPTDWQVNKCLSCGRHLGLRTVPSNRPSHPRPTTL